MVYIALIYRVNRFEMLKNSLKLIIIEALASLIFATIIYSNFRARKADGLWRHEFAIYGYKLTIHFHIWFFCAVIVRLQSFADINKHASLKRLPAISYIA